MMNENKRKTFGYYAECEFQNCLALLVRKHEDYGPGNILAFGNLGVLVRMNDKVERLKHLSKSGKEPKNETIEDTLRDIANYAVIALMLRHKTFEAPIR